MCSAPCSTTLAPAAAHRHFAHVRMHHCCTRPPFSSRKPSRLATTATGARKIVANQSMTAENSVRMSRKVIVAACRVNARTDASHGLGCRRYHPADAGERNAESLRECRGVRGGAGGKSDDQLVFLTAGERF